MHMTVLIIHSALRWGMLALLLVSVVRAFKSLRAQAPWTSGDRGLALATVIATDLQLTVGVLLYAVSPLVRDGLRHLGQSMSDHQLRFFVVEHAAMMVLAVACVHMGWAMCKRTNIDRLRHKRVFVFFLLALLLVLAAVPWPFREAIGRPWVRY